MSDIYYQPRQTKYKSQYVPMPLDFMQKSLQAKQAGWDKNEALLDEFSEMDIDSLPGRDKARAKELLKEIETFRDESVGKDLGSSEYTREFKKFQRKIKGNKDLKKITSAYNTWKETEELKKKWQGKAKPHMMADVFGEADRRYKAYTTGEGFEGDISLEDSSNIIAGINPIKASKEYFSQVSSDELESLTGVTTGGKSPEKMATIAQSLYSDWRNGRAGAQYEMQYDNKKLSGIVPNENYLDNTKKLEVLGESGNPIVDGEGNPVTETEYETYTREKDEWLENQFYQIGQSYANSKLGIDDSGNKPSVENVTSVTKKDSIATPGAETTQDLQEESTNAKTAAAANKEMQKRIDDYNKAIEKGNDGNFKYNDQNSIDLRETNSKKIDEMSNQIKDNNILVENYENDIEAVAIAQINNDPNTTTPINETQINQAMTDVKNNDRLSVDLSLNENGNAVKYIVSKASSENNYIGDDGLYMTQREMLDVDMGEATPVTKSFGIKKQIDNSSYVTDKHELLLAQLKENIKEKSGSTLGSLWEQRKNGTINSTNKNILEKEIEKLYNTESADYNIYDNSTRATVKGKYQDKTQYTIAPTPNQALEWGFHEDLRYIPNSVIQPGQKTGALDYTYTTIPLDIKNKSKSGTYATWSNNSKQGDVQIKYYEAIKEKIAGEIDKKIANGESTEAEKFRQLKIIDNLIAHSKFQTEKESEIINPAPVFNNYYSEGSAGQANLLQQRIYTIDEVGLENYNNSPEFTDEFQQAFNEHKGSKTNKFKLVSDSESTVIDGTVVSTSDNYLQDTGTATPWESNGPITIEGVAYNTPKEAEAAGYINIRLNKLTAVSSEIPSNGAPETLWNILYDKIIKDPEDETKKKHLKDQEYNGAKIQMSSAIEYVDKLSSEYLAAYKDYATHGKNGKADEAMLEYLKVRDRDLFNKFDKVKNIGEGESQSVIVPLLEDQGIVRMDVKQLQNNTWAYDMTYVDANGNRQTSVTRHTYDSYSDMINSILPFRDIRDEMYKDAVVTFAELEQ